MKKTETTKKQPSKQTTRKPKQETLPPLPEMANFPTVKKGSKETGYITLLQTNLKNRGYYNGKIDGKFGDRTEQAVKDFQKDLGKPISGSVGPKTWEQLSKSMAVKIQPKKPEAEPVKPQTQPESQQLQGTRVLIEGLSRYQADLLVKLLQGHTECRIL